MSNPSFHLYQLQKLDLRLDQINQRVDQITTQLRNNPKLLEAENQLKISRQEIQKKDEELNNLEQLSKNKKIKIEQSEAVLYGGKNTNPKELKDLQIEIDSLKRSLSALEENQLTLMTLLDDLNQELDNKQSIYDSVLKETEQENQHLFIEKIEFEKEIEKLLKERQAVSGQIQADALSIYERLRPIKNHIAVTGIEDQCCAVCGREITASDIQKARSSSTLSFCPSCGRILYAG